MVKLFLCEKPSQGRDIARVLGASQKHDGYMSGSGVMVTWCFGHLIEMASPEEYNPDLKTWRLETLPIIPGPWQFKVKGSAKKQYKIITGLFKQTDELVIATDPDREGEMIAREVIALGRWQGAIQRLWLSALDDISIKKALQQLKPGAQTESLYHAALARSKADWLVGMSLSRLYTLAARAQGVVGVLSVGRVQTPTLSLVVNRDRTIEQFKPVPYYDVWAAFMTQPGAVFKAKWLVPEDLSDEQGRCIKKQPAIDLAQSLIGQQGLVMTAKTERVKEKPPPLFDLSSLQQEGSKRYGLGAQQVLDIAQVLYEQYKATTYPRTDCQYLPQSQFVDVPVIFTALAKNNDYQPLIPVLGEPPKAFNDKKITAHHAIIPTQVVVKTDSMSVPERQMYDLIIKRYLAQFYPDHVYDKTTLHINVGQDSFKTTGRVQVDAGWRYVLIQSKDSEKETRLPPVKENEQLTLQSSNVENKQTQPPARYTEGTLIQAMKTISQLIERPDLRKLLKEKTGIGTEATRAGIITTLLQRNFLTKKGKKELISSDKGRLLIDALPETVKDPATTAIWEQALDEIAENKRDADLFVGEQIKAITFLTEQGKKATNTAFADYQSKQPVYDCPVCQQPMRKRKGKTGWFWGCSGYPDCQTTLPDNQGKPGNKNPKPKDGGRDCPECMKGRLVSRIIKNGKDKGRKFLGCNRFPECRHTEG